MCANLELARQWYTKAGNDLLNADNNLAAERIPFDTVCFHCQQAAEKFLKTYLVAHGQTPPHSHDLLLLLERILPLNGEAENLRDVLSLLMPYAVEIRYPDDWFQPSLEDTTEARTAVDRIFTWLQRALPEVLEHVEEYPPDEKFQSDESRELL